MPPIEKVVSVQDEKTEEEIQAAKPVIGIIYPPPEVRNIVDKTASFVARNGPEFESRIRQNEINNPKFNFLQQNDPYHAYYQYKVKEFKEGKAQEPAVPKPGQLAAVQKQQAEQARLLLETIVPKEPPPEFEFIADPPSISAFDLDVVRLTAQFVARNGRQFLTNLMNREQRNYQFDFLRPQHSLFNYFTKLVEQYTKILIPPKDLQEKLTKESEEYKEVLQQVKYRVEWCKYQIRERKKEEEALERERIAYTQIDWHDFVVVETVDFQPNEQGNFPPPTTPDEVGARILMQERGGGEKADDQMEVESDESEDEEDGEEIDFDNAPTPPLPEGNLQEMEGESSSEEDEPVKIPTPAPPQPPMPPPPPPPSEIPPLPPTPDQVIIKKDYNPKARPSMGEITTDMVSPITGEKIPAHKVQEHMRIGLLDPKWIQERQRAMNEKKEQEEVYAPGVSIESSLKQLAERRTDIFGVGVEETQIGKKIGEEERKEQRVVWDGHTASMEKVTQKARENISIEEQIATIHKTKGLVADEEKEKIGPTVPKVQPPPPPPPSKPAPPPQPPMNMHKSMAQPPLPRLPMSAPPMPLMNQPQRLMMISTPRPPMNVIGMQPQPMMPQPMMARPPRPGFAPTLLAHPPGPPKPPSMDEPPAKKAKTEEQLIPEDVFLSRNKGPVTFKVMVPKADDKPEWKLNGQMLTYTLPLSDSIAVMKAKLNESLGLPAGKQKLQYDGIFMKDSNSLAYYNINKGAVISLQLKERGGRKK
ncbi:splicing factor 3A subunit 1-like [Mytilus trossulus]|uniref:splicing factor 3A subunit 1-like n=1 Tax=Mytilus trossulus TaxID=6551 RepID=UPI003007F06D